MSGTILLFNIVVVIVVAVTAGFKGGTADLPFDYDPSTMYVHYYKRLREIVIDYIGENRSQISSGIHILINACK